MKRVICILILFMTLIVGKVEQERGPFDDVDDWLKYDRFVFVGWSGHILQLVDGLQEQHS
jgi:hypothetical protein